MFFGIIPPSSSLLAEKNRKIVAIINYCHTAFHVGIVVTSHLFMIATIFGILYRKRGRASPLIDLAVCPLNIKHVHKGEGRPARRQKSISSWGTFYFLPLITKKITIVKCALFIATQNGELGDECEDIWYVL